MIQGKKRQDITTQDLYRITSGGKDVYVKYLGRISKGSMKRPWGDDSHPSFGIWQAADGVWMWKDQAREEVGGPIQFVQKLFNLSHPDAIRKICSDLGITNEHIEASRVYESGASKVIVPMEYSHITAKIMKFKERHHQFWNCVGVSEDWCKKFDCYAVKELAINRKKMVIGEYERVFVYLAKDIDKVKVYFPDRDDGGRFRTNVPFHYLWNCKKITKPCDKLVVHKSMKDLITFAQIHPHNIATQNESIKLFNSEVIQEINSISPEPWLFYGADNDGVMKSQMVTKLTGWRYINTPKTLLPEINDVYSYVKVHGIKSLEQFCKSKNLL